MDFQADDLLPAPEIDFAILADGVHASAGKIYVLGGGWDTIFVQQFPARHHTLGLGLRIRVPYLRRTGAAAPRAGPDGPTGTPARGGPTARIAGRQRCRVCAHDDLQRPRVPQGGRIRVPGADRR